MALSLIHNNNEYTLQKFHSMGFEGIFFDEYRNAHRPDYQEQNHIEVKYLSEQKTLQEIVKKQNELIGSLKIPNEIGFIETMKPALLIEAALDSESRCDFRRNRVPVRRVAPQGLQSDTP